MNRKELFEFEQVNIHQALKSELAEAEQHCAALSQSAEQECEARFSALATNIQRFCGSESFRSVIQNLCYLHPDILSVCGGSLAYRGTTPPALPFDHVTAFSVAESAVGDVKRAAQGILQRAGDMETQLRVLCVGFCTLRSIYARISELKAKAYQSTVSAEMARVQEIRQRLDDLLRASPWLADAERVAEIVAAQHEAAAQQNARFRFENMTVSENYGDAIKIPFAQSKNGDAAEILYWEPVRDGILYVELPDGDIDAPLGFVKAVTMQFLYAYPGTDKQIFYCCKEASSVMDKFLANLANEKEGVGEQVFFRGIQQIEARDFRREAAECFEYLREETKQRLSLLDEAGADTVYAYNAAHPKNIQKPLLVIMHDYPNGFDDCNDLAYLFKEGKALGIHYLVLKNGREEKRYGYYEDNIVSPERYAGYTCVFSGGSFGVAGRACEPLLVGNEKIKELIRALSALGSKLHKDTVSYEEIGFGTYAAAEALDRISIPIALCNNEVYNLDFSSGGANCPIAYLLVGAPGTGKSSLIDAMIINGAMTYSPDDLTFYLLDFKDGVSSAAYKGKNAIPHVRVIAENNKEEDAAIILTNILQEKERRNEIFKSCGIQNIAAYNRKYTPHMPRIVIVIDECQVLFENPDLAKSCESIARQGRSAGIHLLLASQSVSSGMMNSAGKFIDGRFCFEVDRDDAERIINRYDAQNLHTEVPKGSGLALASLDNGAHCDKIRIAWHDERIADYSRRIREKWLAEGYALQLTVAGEKSPLSVLDACRERNLLGAAPLLKIPFGENYFDHSVECLDLTESGENGKMRSMLVLGESEETSADILASVLTGALRAGADIKLVDESEGRAIHKFFGGHPSVSSKMSGSGYLELLGEAYAELQRRSKNRRDRYTPYFLVLHGLQYINEFIDDTVLKRAEPVHREAPSEAPVRQRLDLRAIRRNAEEAEAVEIRGRKTLLQLLRELSRVPGMYVVITVSDTAELGDFSERSIFKGCDYKILQHNVGEAVRNIMEDTFKLKMINGLNENMVLVSARQQYVKARFFQYDLSNDETKRMILEAAKEKGNEAE